MLQHSLISEWISGASMLSVIPPNEGSLRVQHVTVGTRRPKPSTFNYPSCLGIGWEGGHTQ